MEKPYISVVSPFYKGELLVDVFLHKTITALNKITDNFEIILVDDGSPDSTWNQILTQTSLDSRVKGIKLSRNFGQHPAIIAGLNLSKGSWIVVMDCDLQDNPEELSKLFDKAQEGFDIVLASRNERVDSIFVKICSLIFYKILNFLSGYEFDHSISNFGIYHRRVIDSVLQLSEHLKCFPVLINWVGFKKTKVNVKHQPRYIGESSYKIGKKIKLAMDIILAYSNKPLRLILYFGFFTSLISFSIGLFYLVLYFNKKIEVLGFASLIVSISFFSGLLLFTLGVIGLYIGKIFNEVKSRPIFIISEKKNIK